MTIVNTRLVAQSEAYRADVVRLYLQGLTQAEVGKLLGISQQAVSQHLKRARAAWQAQTMRAVGELVAQELAKLDQLERSYWSGFRMSTGADAEHPIAGPLPGDPAFLNGVLKCIDQRCKLLGLYGGVKTSVANPEREASAPLDGLSERDSARVLELFQVAHARAQSQRS